MKKFLLLLVLAFLVTACGPVQKQAAVASKAAEKKAMVSVKGKVPEAYFSAPPVEEEELPVSYF